MSAVLETSDRHVDRVSVIVDPFWTTIVYKAFPSGKGYRLRSSDKQMNRRGKYSTFGMLEGGCGYTGTVFGFVIFF